MALTDTAIKAAKLPATKKQLKLSDSGGLYLLIAKTSKRWRLDYRMDGKRKTLTIGNYPDVPLAGRKDKSGNYCKGARDYQTEAKQLITQGIDPLISRRESPNRQGNKRYKMPNPTHLRWWRENGITCTR